MTIAKKQKGTEVKQGLTYQNMFWLFMMGNVFGVLFEGIWSVIKFGRWESHVITIWGPFCLIYGVCTVSFYILCTLVEKRNILMKFLIFAVVADLIEYICAMMIEDGLGMRAWTYQSHFMNIQGRVSLDMTIAWGIIGLVYYYFIVPRLVRLFHKMHGQFWRLACIILTIFMTINMGLTVVCMVRWSERHKGNQSTNKVGQFIDETYDDIWMKKRFCEWWFIDEQKVFWQEYRKR